jgi:hypothetical protein
MRNVARRRRGWAVRRGFRAWRCCVGGGLAVLCALLMIAGVVLAMRRHAHPSILRGRRFVTHNILIRALYALETRPVLFELALEVLQPLVSLFLLGL